MTAFIAQNFVPLMFAGLFAFLLFGLAASMAWRVRGAAALAMPAQAAPHMATQWGPPTKPMNKAVTAIEVCMTGL